jgi:hypothetical protein
MKVATCQYNDNDLMTVTGAIPTMPCILNFNIQQWEFSPSCTMGLAAIFHSVDYHLGMKDFLLVLHDCWAFFFNLEVMVPVLKKCSQSSAGWNAQKHFHIKATRHQQM